MTTLSDTNPWSTTFTCIAHTTLGARCTSHIPHTQRSISGALLKLVWLWEPTLDDARRSLGAVAQQCLCDGHQYQLTTITREWQRELVAILNQHAPAAEISLAREVRRVLSSGLPQAVGQSPYEIVRLYTHHPPADVLDRVERIKRMEERVVEALVPRTPAGTATTARSRTRASPIAIPDPDPNSRRERMGYPRFVLDRNIGPHGRGIPPRRHYPRRLAMPCNTPQGLRFEERAPRFVFDGFLPGPPSSPPYGRGPVRYGRGPLARPVELEGEFGTARSFLTLREQYEQSLFGPLPVTATPGAWRSGPTMAESLAFARPSLGRSEERRRRAVRVPPAMNDVEALIDRLGRLNASEDLYAGRTGSASHARANRNDCSHQAIRRKLEGDCPICLERIVIGEGLVWCKEGCGQNLHRACWRQYANGETRPKCVVCRARWSTRACLCDEGLPV